MLAVFLLAPLIFAGPLRDVFTTKSQTLAQQEFLTLQTNNPQFGGGDFQQFPVNDWNGDIQGQPRNAMRIGSDVTSQEDDEPEYRDKEFDLTWTNDLGEMPPEFQLPQSVPISDIFTQSTPVTALTQSIPLNAEYNETYKLNRYLTTIPQVWEEYSRGINGNPSIRSLESRLGKKWRISENESSYYYKRKKIYDYIKQLMSHGIPEQNAVSLTEALRISQKRTLDQFERYLAQINKPIIQDNNASNGVIYKMNRNLTTVPQVWQEYTSGLKGNPSVRDLEANYGPRWRKNDTERVFFSNRKKIYDMIEELIRMGQTEDDAVAKVEALRVTNKWMLNRLQNSLILYKVNDGIIESRPNPFNSIIYNQMRNLTTVPQVWEEYTLGIYGNPSVRSLDMEYGSNWLNSSADRKFYRGRKSIYNAIESLIAEGKTEPAAVNEIELMRVQNNWSLNLVQSHIFQGNKRPRFDQVPVYRQYRNLSSVREIWNEYKVGINGYPSVESLDANYGSRWRSNPDDRTFYYRRKKIYTAIETLVSHGMSDGEAVDRLQNYLIQNSKNLRWLLGNSDAIVQQLLSEWSGIGSALSTLDIKPE